MFSMHINLCAIHIRELFLKILSLFRAKPLSLCMDYMYTCIFHILTQNSLTSTKIYLRKSFFHDDCSFMSHKSAEGSSPKPEANIGDN